ncbi:MAG TPA: hypothetical protein VK701_02605 [Solirubrobacteraceae bacterium]|nr:hypothetical protein [Solirubrobacteraceae bacterium]
MAFLEAIAEHLTADLIWVCLVSAVVTRGVFRTAWRPVVITTLFRRHTTIRFSASAILRVQLGSDFLMAMTDARGQAPPYWAPFGGVIKCRPSALRGLNDLEVQTDWLSDAEEDMDRDLRVKMVGHKFWRFIRWYWSGEGRESPTEALCRELKEELSELGLDALVRQLSDLEFQIDAVKTTGLFRQDGILHYRLFYVMDIVSPNVEAFERELLDHRQLGRLEMVSSEEIDRGAHGGVAVGGHSAFLLPAGKYLHRQPSYK